MKVNMPNTQCSIPDIIQVSIPKIRRIDGRDIPSPGHRIGSGKSRNLRTYQRMLRVWWYIHILIFPSKHPPKCREIDHALSAYTRMSMQVSSYNLFRGLTTYLYWGYNLATKYQQDIPVWVCFFFEMQIVGPRGRTGYDRNIFQGPSHRGISHPTQINPTQLYYIGIII